MSDDTSDNVRAELRMHEAYAREGKDREIADLRARLAELERERDRERYHHAQKLATISTYALGYADPMEEPRESVRCAALDDVRTQAELLKCKAILLETAERERDEARARIASVRRETLEEAIRIAERDGWTVTSGKLRALALKEPETVPAPWDGYARKTKCCGHVLPEHSDLGCNVAGCGCRVGEPFIEFAPPETAEGGGK